MVRASIQVNVRPDSDILPRISLIFLSAGLTRTEHHSNLEASPKKEKEFMQNSSESVIYNGVHALPNVSSLEMHSSLEIYTHLVEYSGRNSAIRLSDAAFYRL